MSERDDVLAEAIRRIESLRQQNPMNGDGSNHLLDRAQMLLAETPHLEAVVMDARAEHRARWNREYVEFHARHNPTPTPHPTDSDARALLHETEESSK